MLRNARGPRLRWDKFYKWSKHASAGAAGVGNPIHGTRTASLVVEADEGWVRKLTTLRSDIIHYESEKVNGRVDIALSLDMPRDKVGRPFSDPEPRAVGFHWKLEQRPSLLLPWP